ncbi:MAG TPA: hypothetical protein PLO14_03155 [Accumulibacter sp.]|uniref:hypothetical protein n=1 Tax=Accumulibacter sp. TaxID=2053492 RepID=UPI0025DF64BA|nr:hypothetical protein [Accumulibacter sp.]MCM8599934.1 hypothetical protein [Accumulibacter sp.]MCM8664118.1 hypothetical protein [Accumulibacter sp.]HNC51226.1 hypothetical protein [Accumulibacter sp.]
MSSLETCFLGLGLGNLAQSDPEIATEIVLSMIIFGFVLLTRLIHPAAIESSVLVLSWLLRALIVPVCLLLGLLRLALCLAAELIRDALVGAARAFRRTCTAFRLWRFLGKPWAVAWHLSGRRNP